MARLILSRFLGVQTFGRTAGALLLAAVLSASGPSCGVMAQGSGCADSCRAAFGACYKSTANRAACEMQLQHCLEGCLKR